MGEGKDNAHRKRVGVLEWAGHQSRGMATFFDLSSCAISSTCTALAVAASNSLRGLGVPTTLQSAS